MKAMIAAGGRIDDEFLLNYIKREKYDLMLAVDSGLGFFDRMKLNPDYIIGDFDSVEEEVLDRFVESSKSVIVRLNPMKDDTDTEHALHAAMEAGCEIIHLFGVTGSRLDHVLGNLQLLGLGLKAGVDCRMIDPNNQIRLISKETVIIREEQFGKYVSLIPYTPKVKGLTLTGFAYPLDNHTMSSFYLEDAAPVSGISNEIAGREGRISMEDGILVLVESRD